MLKTIKFTSKRVKMFSYALFLGHIAISAFIIVLFACSAGGPQLQSLQLAYNLKDILINIIFLLAANFCLIRPGMLQED